MKTETRGLQKVSVLLSEEDACRFESYCAEFGHKKSTLIARLVRDFLNRENYRANKAFPSNTQKSLEGNYEEHD